jgi:hypothetical protein
MLRALVLTIVFAFAAQPSVALVCAWCEMAVSTSGGCHDAKATRAASLKSGDTCSHPAAIDTNVVHPETLRHGRGSTMAVAAMRPDSATPVTTIRAQSLSSHSPPPGPAFRSNVLRI